MTIRLVRLIVLITCSTLVTVAHGAEVLTNAFDVLALSAKDALSSIPVSFKGVVTAAQTNWGNGRFFVQDSSGGVFVENKKGPQPTVGDLIEVSGVSHPGGYAPIITKSHWKKVGTAPLPEAKQVSIERLMSGTEDSQRIEISGIVRSAQFSGDRLETDIASGGYRLRAYAPVSPNIEPKSLVGAKVLVRATVATTFTKDHPTSSPNEPLRHFVNVTLYVPRSEDFILQAPPSNPFEEPLTLLNAIGQYRHNRSPGDQVRVKGVVTYQRKGEDLFLRDNTGGLQVKTKLTNSLSPGEVVEAVGFPAVENALPVLEDAVFRETGEARVELKPLEATVPELQLGRKHADFIVLTGRLIDRLAQGVGRTSYAPAVRTTLVLQTTNFMFVAERDTMDPNPMLASIPIGSLVEVTGICLLDNDQNGSARTMHLLLPSSHAVRILEKPSWLTTRHLLASLAVVSVVLIAAIGWTAMVSKRNIILKSLVRENAAARQALQQAHDLLEDRVRERTNQLKVEMTARKESEVQFRAVLTERTRLAQEIHDTLEQGITGVALQLDMVDNLFRENPDDASRHLKLARSLMRQSQADVRHSVWGLRSRATEPFNLANALLTATRQTTNDAGIRIDVQTVGEPMPLSEVVEENLLRIGQEAVTNVVKHADASVVTIHLRFEPQSVSLEVKDDGKGFTPDACAGPQDGHFGLLGIRERAERLGGQAFITSAPGSGSTIRVEIPNQNSNGSPASQLSEEVHEETT
jgi:signal transduction histidine kinase